MPPPCVPVKIALPATNIEVIFKLVKPLVTEIQDWPLSDDLNRPAAVPANRSFPFKSNVFIAEVVKLELISVHVIPPLIDLKILYRYILALT